MPNKPVRATLVGQAVELYARRLSLQRQAQKVDDELSALVSDLSDSEMEHYLSLTNAEDAKADAKDEKAELKAARTGIRGLIGRVLNPLVPSGQVIEVSDFELYDNETYVPPKGR
jgi:hypothetical protein